MSQPVIIKTILKNHELKLKEKGSTFIGRAIPANELHEAEAKLNRIKKKYYDATHNCYAFQIFPDTVKYSDDGEPSGSAGIRIYNAMQHFDLTNLIIVVTRYFGGIKLGIGPLGKAYYNTAFQLLQKCEITRKTLYSKIRISYEYELASHVHHILSMHGVKSITNSFEVTPIIECLIEPHLIDQLSDRLTEISRGKIVIKVVQENVLT